MSVDAGWVDRVWINLLKSNIVLKILFGVVESLTLHVVFDSHVSQFLLMEEQLVNLVLDSIDRRTHILSHALEENGVVSKGQVSEVLELLGGSKQVEVVLEGLSELLVEDWQSRDVDKKVTDVIVIEQFLDEFARVL